MEEDPELERKVVCKIKPMFEMEWKAVEELLKEAKRGRTRAETMGAMGWLKCPLAGTNKRFLINTIKNTLPSQKEQDQEREQKEDSKEPEPNKSRKEEKPKKRRIHPYTPSFQSRRRVNYSPPRHRSRNQHTKDKHEKRSSKR
ncbi:Polr1d [Columba guinea]|nr:Polr1d [Columba guinea]